MITRKTVEKIVSCYAEWVQAEQVLTRIREAVGGEDASEQRKVNLQVWCFSDKNGITSTNISCELARIMIHTHIACIKSELYDANEQVRRELNVDEGTTADERG